MICVQHKARADFYLGSLSARISAKKAAPLSCTEVRKGTAHEVSSFVELATFELLFRGQSSDFRNKAGNTSLKPKLLRAKDPQKAASEATLRTRFARLERAEQEFVRCYENANFDEIKRFKRQQILRWAILQHIKFATRLYSIIAKPLLGGLHHQYVQIWFPVGTTHTSRHCRGQASRFRHKRLEKIDADFDMRCGRIWLLSFSSRSISLELCGVEYVEGEPAKNGITFTLACACSPRGDRAFGEKPKESRS
jgi:hypothetical protein